MAARLVRWLLVALTAAFVAHMLMRAGTRPGPTAQAVPGHNDRIAAMPCAPAFQASSRSPGVMPPMA